MLSRTNKRRPTIRYKKNDRAFNFSRWKDCDRCGISWEERQLRRDKHTGGLVCPECIDMPDHQDHVEESTKELTDYGRKSAPWNPD